MNQSLDIAKRYLLARQEAMKRFPDIKEHTPIKSGKGILALLSSDAKFAHYCAEFWASCIWLSWQKPTKNINRLRTLYWLKHRMQNHFNGMYATESNFVIACLEQGFTVKQRNGSGGSYFANISKRLIKPPFALTTKVTRAFPCYRIPFSWHQPLYPWDR